MRFTVRTQHPQSAPLLRGAMLIAALAGLGDCTGQTEPEVLTMAVPVATTVDQTGVVGMPLPLPLSAVLTTNGEPRAGIAVAWKTTSGRIVPGTSVTDASGLATATWTLDTIAGRGRAEAMMVHARGRPVNFFATGEAGPAVSIGKLRGDGQATPANLEFPNLVAVVKDRYGNARAGETLSWTVEMGPVTLVAVPGPTDGFGQSFARIAPTGTPGFATVRAALPGGLSVTFGLSIGPPKSAWSVVLDTHHPLAFISGQNRSNPAVDTIPTGGTMIWTLSPIDLEGHSVVSVGTPSFSGGGEFPYALHPTVRATFTAPGTYRYADSYHPNVTGTVVVK